MTREHLRDGAASCAPLQWTAPARVTSDPSDRAVARFPSVAAHGARRFVVGNNIRSAVNGVVPAAPFVAWDETGRSLGRPTGSFNFVYPRAFVAGDGTFHMIWGEPTGGARDFPVFQWPPREIVSVWTASFSEGRWSAPRSLYTGAELNWDHASIADFSTGSSEMALVAAPGGRSTSRDVMLFRFHDATWEATPIPTDGNMAGPLYPAYVAHGSQRYLAFIASAESGDQNSVWLQTSSDAGATWQSPRLVGRSGVTPAYEVKALIGPSGDVRLVWLQSLSAGEAIGKPSVVRQRISSDNGVAWTEASDAGPAVWHTQLRAAIDECGRTHVLFADLSLGPESPRLGIRTWDRSWDVGAPLFPELALSGADFRVSASGEMVLVFLAQPQISSDPSALEMLQATTSVSR